MGMSEGVGSCTSNRTLLEGRRNLAGVEDDTPDREIRRPPEKALESA
jgi:hypothetical protein